MDGLHPQLLTIRVLRLVLRQRKTGVRLKIRMLLVILVLSTLSLMVLTKIFSGLSTLVRVPKTHGRFLPLHMREQLRCETLSFNSSPLNLRL